MEPDPDVPDTQLEAEQVELVAAAFERANDVVGLIAHTITFSSAQGAGPW